MQQAQYVKCCAFFLTKKYNMTVDNYGFHTLRLFVREIVDNVGYDKLYTNENLTYPNAPQNKLYKNPTVITDQIKKVYTEIKKIYILEDNKMDESIYGIYISRGENVYISINGNLNTCWRRFATLKELCSLYIGYGDKESRMSKYTDYYEAIKNAEAKKEHLLNQNNFDDKDDIDSENFAILLAMELMVPYKHRDELRQYFIKYEQGILTMNDIAKLYLMPELILQMYYDKKIIDTNPQIEDFA